MLVVRYRCKHGPGLMSRSDEWRTWWTIMVLVLFVLSFGFFYAHIWLPALVILGLAMLTASVAVAKLIHERMEKQNKQKTADFARKYCQRHRLNSLDSAAMRRATDLALAGRDYELPPDDSPYDDIGTLAKTELQNEENEKVEKCLNIMTVVELEHELAPGRENRINQLLDTLDYPQPECRPE